MEVSISRNQLQRCVVTAAGAIELAELLICMTQLDLGGMQ
jgi:hypothetical protein